MREFQGRVAVVTGATRGMGRAIVARCVQEGMRVVLAGAEGPALERAATEMTAAGGSVLPVVTDVARLADVQALAQRALDAFGGVQLLVNSAGATTGLPTIQTGAKDWLWLLGTNLWGVIHGLQVFVPLMLAQNDAGHIINTAVFPALVPSDLSRPYAADKQACFCRAKTQAVVALSEQLNHDLRLAGEKIRVSVLCPAWIRTQITDALRNRPPLLDDDPVQLALSASGNYRAPDLAGPATEEVAERVFEAIREEVFYILISTQAPLARPMTTTSPPQEHAAVRYAAAET